MDVLAQGEPAKAKPVMSDPRIDATRPAAGIGTGVHVEALDGIRGLAILLVMAFHYGNSAKDFGFQNILLSASGLGWLGVDLFFALSGFLITGILYDAKDKSHYFRNFYARRSLRIFPLYYLALLVVVILAFAWPEAGIWPTRSPGYIAGYLTNFVISFSDPEAAGVLAHYWSLAIEEHFYLVWPMVVFSLTRRQVMGVAVGMVVAAIACRLFLIQIDQGGAAYMITPARMDSLAVGAFFALLIRGPGGLAATIRPAWITAIACALLLVGLIASTGSPSHGTFQMQSIGYTTFALLSAASIVIGMTFKPMNRVLSQPVLRWFGKYSYGLYVWHPIINVILFYTSVRALFGPASTLNSAFLLVFAFALTLVVSWLSYNLWEKQFLRLKSRFHAADSQAS